MMDGVKIDVKESEYSNSENIGLSLRRRVEVRQNPAEQHENMLLGTRHITSPYNETSFSVPIIHKTSGFRFTSNYNC